MIFIKSHYICTQDKDTRLSALLVLLWQIDQFSHRLEALPEPELREVLLAAIGVSGFVEPWEAQHGIFSLLQALETRGALPRRSLSMLHSVPPS